MKDAATAATSAVFLFLPAWLHWLPAAWQVLVMILGGVVLFFTAYNKYLDAMMKRNDLRKAEEGHE